MLRSSSLQFSMVRVSAVNHKHYKVVYMPPDKWGGGGGGVSLCTHALSLPKVFSCTISFAYS